MTKSTFNFCFNVLLYLFLHWIKFIYIALHKLVRTLYGDLTPTNNTLFLSILIFQKSPMLFLCWTRWCDKEDDIWSLIYVHNIPDYCIANNKICWFLVPRHCMEHAFIDVRLRFLPSHGREYSAQQATRTSYLPAKTKSAVSCKKGVTSYRTYYRARTFGSNSEICEE